MLPGRGGGGRKGGIPRTQVEGNKEGALPGGRFREFQGDVKGRCQEE